MTPSYYLRNHYAIPAVGYGTFRTADGAETENAVRLALKAGFRHIDGAAAYGNEKSVGRAIQKSGVMRKDLFITSKVWNDDKGYQSTKNAFYRTLQDLQTDYLDLYLIHWPIAKASRDRWQQTHLETWRALEGCIEAERLKLSV